MENVILEKYIRGAFHNCTEQGRSIEMGYALFCSKSSKSAFLIHIYCSKIGLIHSVNQVENVKVFRNLAAFPKPWDGFSRTVNWSDDTLKQPMKSEDISRTVVWFH